MHKAFTDMVSLAAEARPKWRLVSSRVELFARFSCDYGRPRQGRRPRSAIKS